MTSHHEARKHIDKKLILRLRMFVVITLVMIVIIIYQTVRYDISFMIPLVCIVGGSLIGLIAGRMHKISWDKDGSKIVARMDRIGGVILVLYIGLAIARKQLLGQRVHGPALLAATLAIAAGTMIGRLITMRYGIKKILMEEVEHLFKK